MRLAMTSEEKCCQSAEERHLKVFKFLIFY
jgi:hypothetical protein